MLVKPVDNILTEFHSVNLQIKMLNTSILLTSKLKGFAESKEILKIITKKKEKGSKDNQRCNEVNDDTKPQRGWAP